MTEDETIWPMDSELQTLSMLGTTLAERYKIQRLQGEGGWALSTLPPISCLAGKSPSR